MRVYAALGAPPPSPLVENKLFRDAQRVVTLLVEAGFDERFWRMHTRCHVRHQGQGGRPAALKELDRAQAHPDALLLAVLDADLDRVEGRLVQRPDVVWTDAHDLETTLIGIGALEKLVRHQIGPEKLAAYEGQWGESIRSRLFRHALAMGKLRWLKQREDLQAILFKKEGKASKKGKVPLFDKYDACVDADFTPSTAKVIDAVIAFSNAQQLKARLHPQALSTLPEADPAQLCNGHDLLGFLHAWIRKISSDRGSVEQLADALALACERPWLNETQMVAAIRAWEAAHPDFQVMRDPCDSALR